MQSIAAFALDHAVLVLGLRMALVAAFVVLVAVVAERLGAFLGAMVASLPLYTGPVYLMLALEKDAGWFHEATLGSIAICGISPVFVLAYCMLAVRRGTGVSLAGAALAWILCAAGVQTNRWSLPEALLFAAPIYAVSVLLARGYTRGIALPRTERRWGDLVLRAALVATLSGFTVWVSAHVPAQLAGILSVAPILTTSLILVMHPRVGGAPTAALLAHTLAGLVGMVLAFALVHLTVKAFGVFPALALGLFVTVAWNLMLVGLNRLDRPAPAAARAAPSLPPPAMPRRRT